MRNRAFTVRIQDSLREIAEQGLEKPQRVPVATRGQARIRTQVSAALAPDQIDRAARAFVRARDRCEGC